MNISDIAKMAGVSPSTVSRYLNNGYVSEEKKRVIRKVIDETGYAPLTSAQNLRNRKMNVIGVIVPKISSESISHIVDGITDRLRDTDYQIFLANTDNNVKKEIEYLELFENNFVDGVILSATDFTAKHRQILKRYNKPVVIASQNVPGFPCVYNDDEEAAYNAVTHLAQQGAGHIAYLGVMEEDLSAGHGRHMGYLRALADAGLEADKNLEKIVDFTIYSGYTGIQELIDSGEKFDGLFCATDNIAIGAINCMRYSGLKVPDDVKTAAVGDSVVSKALFPSLTTVHLYYDEIGRESADMILGFLDGTAKSTRQLKLSSELCVRESSTFMPDAVS